MSDKKTSNSDKIKHSLKRIKEIDEQENQLRHERALLLRERAWYTKPSSWIGILAIIVPVILFALNYFISQQKLQLTVMYEEPQALVFLTASVRSRSQILFDDKPIENMYRAKLHIKNTGTMAIDKEHFKDGPIKFTVSSSEKEKNITDKSGIPLILDIVKTSSAEQQQDILQITSIHEPAEFNYIPSLLNPGESVVLEIYLSKVSEYKLKLKGKLSNGDIELVTSKDTLSKNALATAMSVFGSAISLLFGSKWLALTILVLALAISALMCIGLHSFGVENDWIVPNILIFINGLIICGLFLVGIIVTVTF